MSRRPFTDAEDRRLLSLRANNHSQRIIGAELDRDRSSISCRLDYLNAASPEEARARLDEISPPLVPVMITAAEAKTSRFAKLQAIPEGTVASFGDPEPGRSHLDKLNDKQRVTLATVGRTR